MRADRTRALLAGAVSLDPAARAVVDAWRDGAPFGLALTGDPLLAEHLFGLLRSFAAHVVRRADDEPPRAVRTLALCDELADLPSTVARRCTVVLDVGAVVPLRRPTAPIDADVLWRRVVSCLHAHGVHDGAIDVAACAMASGVCAAGWSGDPVELVRRWVAEPRGEVGRERDAGGEPGEASAGSDETPRADAELAGEAPAPDGAAVEGEASGARDESEETAPEAGEHDSADTATGEGAIGPGADAPSAAHDPGTETAEPEGSDGDAASLPTDAPAPAASPADAAGLAGDDASDATRPGARAVALALPDLGDPARTLLARAAGGRRSRRGAPRVGTGRGRPGRVVPLDRAAGRIAVLPTLQRAVERHARAGSDEAFHIGRDDLRGRLRAESTALHTVVVVDGSSSMGRAGAAHARRVADLALAQVYRDRGDVSVVVAAGSRARVAQPRTARVSRARAALEAVVDEGGGTPLADAVRRALAEFGASPRERCRLVIVSDGCATVDLAGRADDRSAAADLRAQLDQAARRAARTVLVPLDARGWRPLERTLAPFRASGVIVAEPE